ncbi:hypothetical protein [Brachybacterium sp. GPGPB12]|uniref:hypothetical protein n=1 Tax=Brachybacterium sp. GPGPB12 TaxID=3023517 RepID=UPI0031343638
MDAIEALLGALIDISVPAFAIASMLSMGRAPRCAPSATSRGTAAPSSPSSARTSSSSRRSAP